MADNGNAEANNLGTGKSLIYCGAQFGGHPLGQRILGPRANVERFTAADVRRHYARVYTARNAVVCAAGPVVHAAVAAGAARYFGGMRTGLEAEAEPAPPVAGGPRACHSPSSGPLVSLSLKTYVPAGGVPGYILAAIAASLIVLLWGNRRFPPALPVIGLGAAYALLVEGHGATLAGDIGLALPSLHVPGWEDILLGFWLLAIPQLPLSLGNSVIATRQTVHDLYPHRPVTLRGIGLTYSAANFVAPLFGGVPVCHGCGGLAGHYGFGARTGGSVVIYGGMYVVFGLLFGQAADQVARLFPQPVLGVVLLFEAVLLMRLARDTASDAREFLIALLVGALAFGLPHGFAVAMIVGTVVYHAARRYGLLIEHVPAEIKEESVSRTAEPPGLIDHGIASRQA